MPLESTLICPDTLVTSAALKTAASADIGATRSSIARSAESLGRFAERRARPSSRSRVSCMRRMGKGVHGRKGRLPLTKAETAPKPDSPQIIRATPSQLREYPAPSPPDSHRDWSIRRLPDPRLQRESACVAPALIGRSVSPDCSATIAARPREPAGVDAEARDQSNFAGSSRGARRWMSVRATRYADAHITKIGT